MGRQMISSVAPLRLEHQRILEVADAAEELARKIETQQSVRPSTPVAINELFFLYAHVIHRDKEELLLFPVLRNKGVREGSCIGVLLSEHKENDAAYASMEQAATEYATGDAAALLRWAEAAHVYCNRLRYHVRREELLFMNAEKLLSDAEHADLALQFQRLDEKARRAGLQDRIEAAQQQMSGANKP